MFSRRLSRRKFVKDLTRTRHMTTVSAVVVATTFAPLLGMPDMEELQTFQSAVEGFSDARASVFEPRRDDEAARERSANSVIPQQNEDRSFAIAAPGRDSRRVIRPDRPDAANAEPIEANADAFDELQPLPEEDTELMAPVEDEPVIPEVEEEKPEAPPDLVEPPPQDEPLLEDEDEL